MNDAEKQIQMLRKILNELPEAFLVETLVQRTAEIDKLATLSTLFQEIDFSNTLTQKESESSLVRLLTSSTEDLILFKRNITRALSPLIDAVDAEIGRRQEGGVAVCKAPSVGELVLLPRPYKHLATVVAVHDDHFEVDISGYSGHWAPPTKYDFVGHPFGAPLSERYSDSAHWVGQEVYLFGKAKRYQGDGVITELKVYPESEHKVVLRVDTDLFYDHSASGIWTEGRKGETFIVPACKERRYLSSEDVVVKVKSKKNKRKLHSVCTELFPDSSLNMGIVERNDNIVIVNTYSNKKCYCHASNRQIEEEGLLVVEIDDLFDHFANEETK